jgi:CheY-like chemotaxis protein
MSVREPHGPAEPSIAGIRVLVVDDNHDALEIMKEALTDYGAEVTGVLSVDEAIRVGPSRFDVVLTDLSMPQRTGYDLLRVVRERAPSLPVIAVTGHPQERGAPGFAIHLSKPIDHGDLVRAIHRVVTAHKQSESS